MTEAPSTRPGSARASPERDGARQRLRAIVRERSLIVGHAFTLASGARSRFYFDMKATAFDPEGASLIAELILAAIAAERADYVGGLELGAVPIVACVVERSFAAGRPVRGFVVRKRIKEHGTRQAVEPELEAGRRAVVIEDVTTTGASALQAVEAVRARGCTVAKVVTVVDRLEGAAANLAGHGLELVALLSARDFDLGV